MQNIEFWKELFDTYQSLGEGIKILMIVVPPLFFLSCLALFFWYQIVMKKIDAQNQIKKQKCSEINTSNTTSSDKEERADNSGALPFRGDLLFRVYREKSEAITIYQDHHQAKPTK